LITIEDSDIDKPFKTEVDGPVQLVVCIDDISVARDDYVKPDEKHILKALAFAHKFESETGGNILIHCRIGISSSTAIALATFTRKLGAAEEMKATKMLEKINPDCRPNQSLV
jgi:predicted protein tyrosine phosphatase